MQFIGAIIPADREQPVRLQRFNEYDQLNTAVGGWIEAVYGRNLQAFVNEEGLLLNLPVNERASHLFGQRLVGDVVLFGGTDAEGDCVSLPQLYIDALQLGG